jgi:protein-disulfide isomerase
MNRGTAIALSVAALLLAGLLAWLALRPDAAPPAQAEAAPAQPTLVRFHSPVVGPAEAPVTIVEFFDPACEGCRAYYPYVKQILALHPREARLVMRYVPFHGDVSVEGVRILEAARQQQRFEPVLEALFNRFDEWASHAAPSPDRAWQIARDAGLDQEAARAWLAQGAVEKMLEIEMADARSARIGATPTFFVNGKALPEPGPDALLRLVRSEANAAAGGAAGTAPAASATSPLP